MRNRDLILIGLIAIIVIIVGSAWYVTVQSQKNADEDMQKFKKEQEHRDYCANWSTQLDRDKEQIQNQSGDSSNIEQLNKEINLFNKECAF